MPGEAVAPGLPVVAGGVVVGGVVAAGVAVGVRVVVVGAEVACEVETWVVEMGIGEAVGATVTGVLAGDLTLGEDGCNTIVSGASFSEAEPGVLGDLNEGLLGVVPGDVDVAEGLPGIGVELLGMVAGTGNVEVVGVAGLDDRGDGDTAPSEVEGGRVAVVKEPTGKP